jgi:anti-sigma factor RsiW
MSVVEMSCREVVELVTGYLEGTLSEPEHAAVSAHLAECDGCEIVLGQFRETIRLTGMLTEESLTEDQRTVLLEAFRGWRSPD